MKSYAYLFDGLTVRRVLSVTAICAAAAAAVVWIFLNTYRDLLVSALCVGYTSMVLFTVAGNIRQVRVPREVMQLAAIVIGSFLGTILAGLVKGRDVRQMFGERMAGVSITMGLGIGFGCVVVAMFILREKHARDQARFHRAESERHQLEKNLLEAKLALMQAQVEPHFLFNTLSNVRRLCQSDAVAGRAMLGQLARYLRAALPRMREQETTLGEEIDLISAYLGVHQIRMGARLETSIDAPAPLLAARVPPMMLATLVENAIKHGIAPLAEGGAIRVSAQRSGDTLALTVADTGRGLVEGSGSGVGLANIRARLATLYGERAALRLEANSPRGVVALITLPLS